jgi:F-type H+-transporting ATPase subunit b
MDGGKSIRTLVVSLALVVALPAVALAEGEGHGKTNPLTFAADLGVWTLVVFIVLLFVLRKWAWGPMLEGLHRREDSIRGAISEAQKAREEAQRLQDQWHQEMARAQDKVRDIHEEARRRAEQNANEITSKARADIQAERDRLRREIEVARDQALQELWNHTARLATDISSRVLRKQLNPDDQRRLMDEALSEIGNRRMAGNGQGAGGGA